MKKARTFIHMEYKNAERIHLIVADKSDELFPVVVVRHCDLSGCINFRRH